MGNRRPVGRPLTVAGQCTSPASHCKSRALAQGSMMRQPTPGTLAELRRSAPGTSAAHGNTLWSSAMTSSPTPNSSPTATSPSGVPLVGAARLDAMSAALARNWWLVALRGVVAILFGAVAFIAPGAFVLSLVLFFAAYMFADGLFAIVGAVRAAQRHERWGFLLLEGLVD